MENKLFSKEQLSKLKENINKDIDLETLNKTIELQKEIMKRVREIDWGNLYNVITI